MYIFERNSVCVRQVLFEKYNEKNSLLIRAYQIETEIKELKGLVEIMTGTLYPKYYNWSNTPIISRSIEIKKTIF